jgi:hypothetical protein
MGGDAGATVPKLPGNENMILPTREPDGRTYLSGRPQELALRSVAHAATHAQSLVLRPDTPVIPDEGFPFDTYVPVLSERTTWQDVEAFVRRLGDVGCNWVNLRFTIDGDGAALVRYEAKPDGVPLPDGGIPAINGGFDCHRLMTWEELVRLHPRLPPSTTQA